MWKTKGFRFTMAMAACGLLAGIVPAGPAQQMPPAKAADTSAAPSGYDKLPALLREVRALRQPLLSKRMMDYSPAAVEERRAKIAEWQKQLAAIEPNTWPVAQQVDYLLVRAELDALDFDYRVLRPWSRDPGLYVDMARDVAFAALRTQTPAQARAQQLASVIPMLAAARKNLTEAARELAILALYNLEFADGVGHDHPFREVPPAGVIGWFEEVERMTLTQDQVMQPAAQAALTAVRGFHNWMLDNLPRMTGAAGVGRENYEWYLRRVHFEPFTADDVVRIGDREWRRALAGLAMERARNAGLPPLEPAASAEEYKRRLDEADAHVRKFIAEKKFLTLPPDVPRLGDNVPWMAREGGRRNFWEQVQYRDPLPDKVHAVIPGHRFDLLLHRSDTRPVRRAIQNGSRVEGWGFYLEEAMMNAGLLDTRPRTRELFWIFAAARAVRNRTEVKLHLNEWTVEQAVQYMVESVPWMDPDVARVDCEIYLRQPAYGQNYMMGKIQIEELLAERMHAQGAAFSLQRFHDEFLAAGLIPVGLIRWEMTGKRPAE